MRPRRGKLIFWGMIPQNGQHGQLQAGSVVIQYGLQIAWQHHGRGCTLYCIGCNTCAGWAAGTSCSVASDLTFCNSCRPGSVTLNIGSCDESRCETPHPPSQVSELHALELALHCKGGQDRGPPRIGHLDHPATSALAPHVRGLASNHARG